MNAELLTILETIERDKGIDREILIQAVEAALATAAKKTLGMAEEDELTVTIDRQNGKLHAVAAGQEVRSLDFSRIAAQTAKQVIIQKIREAEREVVFTEYQGRVGDILTGTVHRFERGDIIVEVGRAEAVLPKSERIPHEEHHQGDRVQGYVLEVRKTTRGPAIVLSRTHEGFIRGLFALEVPEIAEGIVQIKGIAREAGDRTKIAVTSTDEKVDCVGACVGMRGTRVKNIVRELHGEKVDIIRWHDDIKEFIAAALSPAQISEIQLQGDAKQALVIVDDDQLSLAIGKKGQNVRLASKLSGWQLDIKSRSQMTAGPDVPLASLPGVGPAIEQRLAEAGVTSVLQLAVLTMEQLTAIKGIGEKTAHKILDAAKTAVQPKANGAAAHAAETPVAAEADEVGERPRLAPPPAEPPAATPEEGAPAGDVSAETPPAAPAPQSADPPADEPPDEHAKESSSDAGQ